jgi:branched-chain amino acid transport system substrate-binding protein
MNDLSSRKFVLIFCAVLISLLAIACAPAVRQATNPSAAARPVLPVEAILLRAVDQYEKANYQRTVELTDSLARLVATADSQYNYLRSYYGLHARLQLGQEAEALSSYLEQSESLIPAIQFSELRGIASGKSESSQQAPEAGPAVAHRIGIILPLSGQFFEFGEAILEGAKLAAEQFNKQAGAGVQLELVVRDDAGDPVRAATLGRQLATDSTVAALVGSHGDEATLSLALVSAAQDIPLVCPTADAPGLDGIGSTVHVLNRTDPQLSATVADAAVDLLRLHTFAVVAEDDERGELLARGFIDRVKAAGGTVVSDLRYLPEASNFENQMSLIQRYLPDAIYLTAKSDMITQLASQVHYYGMGDVQLIGGEYFDSERVIRMGGDYVDGGLFSSPFYSDSEKLCWQEFKQQYEDLYRRPVNRFSAYGYDAVGLVLNALESLPVNRGKLAETMRSGKSYSGATGVYSVDGDGRVDREYFVLRLASGNILPAGAGQTDEVPLEAEPGQVPQNN